MTPERDDGATDVFDWSGLKLPVAKTLQGVAPHELANNAQAFAKYLSRVPSRPTAPFTRRWMLRLHKEMFGQVWTWAGKPRTTMTNFGVQPWQIEGALQALEDDLKLWHADPLEDGVQLHFRAIDIHPFRDGNGRWARLLVNIWLRQRHCGPIQWPEPSLREEASPIRQQYIAAIKLAVAGQFQPLIELHRQFQLPL